MLIVDPTLVSLEGHSYQYDRAFFSAARVVFDDVILYADKSFRDSGYQPLPCRAVLNRLPLDNLKRWGNTFFHSLGPRALRMSDIDSAAHSTVVPNTWSWTLRLAKRLRAW
ncbi:MAG: hypothetical protein N2444_10310, partial [Methylocystis sp.]|nr:hypothetical protein [Methylocystis sp.]